ncbi:hypothetical protein EWM64_g9263 [Hericium alpestre]|uniref:Uncharacterized protein n=1 Tax=Hericium alpestre TaxID=135208 RepID=A0A4Y9ZMK6_9AGAM|nr:hypothetical protein EWM64_g9263 [Hericium alpestre]
MPVAGPAAAEPRQRSYAPLYGASTTEVLDALSVLVEFLDVAQLVWMLCTSPAGTIPQTVGGQRSAQGVRNGGL